VLTMRKRSPAAVDSTAWRPRVRVLLGLLAMLLLASNDASAAALGSLATSVGLLAALGAMIAIKGWSTHAAGGVLSTTGGVLALGAGALLMWRLLRSAGPATNALLPWRSAGSARVRRRGGAGGISADLASRPALNLPAGMGCAELSQALCRHFIELQAAWDAGDLDALGALSTPEMFDDLRAQLCEYGACPNRTEVRALDALLLGYEQRDSLELVCVEFSGMILESTERGVVPFRELWMLERSKQASLAWKLVRQQTLL
jgi:predicted lipid-binding transport protein (Tim44 family)